MTFKKNMKSFSTLLLLILISIVCNGQSLLQTEVSVDLTNAKLKTVLDSVASNSDVQFFYNSNLVLDQNSASIKLNNAPLEKFLDYLYIPTQF